MKCKLNVFAMVAILATSMLFSSCIGSFKLTHKVLGWNRTIDDKFVNELIFIVLHIVPVYEVTYLFDALVNNSIEFWTGESPVAGTQTKQIKGDDGLYTIETTKDGHKISKENTGETVFFHFNKQEKTWNLEANGTSTMLLRVINENEVAMYLPDGAEMIVPLDKAGVIAFKDVVDHHSCALALQ
jgi:hypothetical protein